VAVLGGFHILGARLDRGFEHLLLIPHARGILIRPMRSKPWLTAPDAPRLPPFLLNAVRTFVAVRLRLSVSASTMIATPPGP
jgi:hypothetical protein